MVVVTALVCRCLLTGVQLVVVVEIETKVTRGGDESL